MSIAANKSYQENNVEFLIKSGISLFISYCAYSFLAISVCLITTIILIILITISGENLSLDFLKNLAFIIPKFKEESFSIGIKEIMQIFLVLSLAFMLFCKTMQFVIKKTSNKEININIKQKTIFILLATSLLYIIAFLLVPHMRMAEGSKSSDFYIIFSIFYIINIFSTFIYIGLNHLSGKINLLRIQSVK